MGFVFLHVWSTVSAKQIQKLNLKHLMVYIFGALVRTEASQSFPVARSCLVRRCFSSGAENRGNGIVLELDGKTRALQSEPAESDLMDVVN